MQLCSLFFLLVFLIGWGPLPGVTWHGKKAIVTIQNGSLVTVLCSGPVFIRHRGVLTIEELNRLIPPGAEKRYTFSVTEPIENVWTGVRCVE